MLIISCSAQVFEGHPFIVEAGLSLGGKDVKQVSSLSDVCSLHSTENRFFEFSNLLFNAFHLGLLVSAMLTSYAFRSK